MGFGASFITEENKRLRHEKRILRQRHIYKMQLKRNMKKLERIYDYVAEFYPEIYKDLKRL